MTVVLNLFDSVSATTIPFELSQRISQSGEFRCENFTLSLNANVQLGLDRTAPEILAETSLLDRIRTVRERVFATGCEIVHTHHPRTAALVGLALGPRWRRRYLPGLRHIHTVHNDFGRFSLPAKAAFVSALLSADKVICNSNNTLASIPKIVRNKRKTECFCVAYNGVDTAMLGANGADKAITMKEPFILCAARMVRQKNHLNLLRAFAALETSGIWRLVLCGDGELRDALETEAERLNINDQIDFLGMQTREETYCLMRRCAVFVMPSHWEGFCNANVEAMAAGAALAVSNVEPIPEVVGSAGIYFDPLDVADMARQLQRMIDHPNERNQLGAIGRDRAEQFSIARAASAYSSIYQSVLSEIRTSNINQPFVAP